MVPFYRFYSLLESELKSRGCEVNFALEEGATETSKGRYFFYWKIVAGGLTMILPCSDIKFTKEYIEDKVDALVGRAQNDI